MAPTKVERAIERLQAFEPAEGYWLAFSGGKDSQCIYHLALEAGVKFEPHYNITTADPPELLAFMKRNYGEVQRDRPDSNMWDVIASHRMPPTRMVRYCCEQLKERGGELRTVVTGVRWEESSKRAKGRGVVEAATANKRKRLVFMQDNDEARQMVEHCPTAGKHIVNPIIDWTWRDVWTYIRSRHLDYCRLYDEGFSRLGCIACPQAGGRRMVKDLQRWPTYRGHYLRAFGRMLEGRREAGLPTEWSTAEEVLEWWTGPDPTYPLWEQPSAEVA